MAVLVLPLARRRFPFAAPAALLDPGRGDLVRRRLLLAFIGSLGLVGLASAFLLGNLRDPLKAGVGLIIVVVRIFNDWQHPSAHSQSATSYSSPSGSWSPGSRVMPCVSVPSRLKRRSSVRLRPNGSARRLHVSRWQRSARIARELHDIVAHAVSVMVLQVGAVRHRLPDALAEDRALRGVERAGRTALAEMRRLLAAMRSDGDEAELLPQPGLDGLDSLLGEIGRAGLPVELLMTQALPAPSRG